MSRDREVVNADLAPLAVVGLGWLGRGIAACALGHGLPVVAYTRSSTSHQAASQYIGEAINELIEHAGFERSLNDTWKDHFTPTQQYADIRDCKFVIESVDEDLSVKRSVFDSIEQVVRPDVPIASNTSAIPISLLQQGRQHPERFLGMHWAAPVHATRFLEVIRGDQTSMAVVQLAEALGRRLGKDPSLVLKDIPGFIVNRLAYALHREALHLLELGVADVETIDCAYRNAVGVWSTLCGPFRWMDLNGGPALYARAEARVLAELSNATDVSPIMKRLADENAQGIVNGHGFYDYSPAEAQAWRKRLHDRVWAVRSLLDQPNAVDPQS